MIFLLLPGIKGLKEHLYSDLLTQKMLARLRNFIKQNWRTKFSTKMLWMIRVFLNVWLNLEVLLPNLLWSQYKGRHEWKSSKYLQNISYWIQRETSSTFLVTDWWQYGAGKQKHGFLTVSNFPRNNYLQWKLFYFKRRQ